MLSKDKIKMLINKGFELDLISFEFNIPMEKINECKTELEAEKKNRNELLIQNANNSAHISMEKMRQAYKTLYEGDAQTTSDKGIELSQEQLESIQTAMSKIEETIANMRGLSKQERRKSSNIVMQECRNLLRYPLTLEQYDKLNGLIKSTELDGLNLDFRDIADKRIASLRREIFSQFIRTIDILQSQTENIEELKGLNKKITIEMITNNQMEVGAVTSKIQSKIVKLQQQAQVHKIKYSISPAIEEVIKELVNGNINIPNAKGVIEEEAKAKEAKRPKSNFNLTHEQEVKQILIQISNVIEERAEEYKIKNPEEAVLQLQELTGCSTFQAVRIVAKHFASRKQFKVAKRVCDIFYSDDRKSEFSKQILSIKREITREEIGDLVLKGMNIEGNYEQERLYLNMIRTGILDGKFKLSDIPLGKSKDGSRSITLSDIWGYEEKASQR